MEIHLRTLWLIYLISIDYESQFSRSVNSTPFLLLIVTNVIQCNEEERIYTNNIPYHTLDSFNRVISALEEYAIKQEHIIDSLKANTNKTIIKYEKILKTSLMFILFLMIASLDIYGRELKVCKDTVITYTLEDNRKIAILLKQGEYDAALCKSLKNIVVGQDTLIDNLKHTLYTLTNQANVYKQSIADLERVIKI